MTDSPLNGAPAPQFTAAYWERAPRALSPHIAIVAMETRDGVKYVRFADGNTASHPVSGIRQLLTVGTVVQVQVIRTGQGHIVTGLYVPQTGGWAWQMTAEDLADYARDLTDQVAQQQMAVKLQMIVHLKGVMREVLDRQEPRQRTDEALDQLAEELATEALIALETGPQ